MKNKIDDKKYYILDFDFDDTLYDKYCYSYKEPSFLGKFGFLNKDYDLSSAFMLEEDLENKILAHASYLVIELNKERNNTLVLKLINDFKNFNELAGGGEEYNEYRLDFINLLVKYEAYEQLIDYVIEINNHGRNAKYPKVLHKVYEAFDNSELYISIANFLLFKKRDYKLSLRFYELSTLSWNAELNEQSFNTLEYNVYKRTYEGYYNIKDYYGDKTLIEIYNKIIKDVSNTKRNKNRIRSLKEKAQELLNDKEFNKEDSNLAINLKSQTIAMYMIYSVSKKVLLDDLLSLMSDKNYKNSFLLSKNKELITNSEFSIIYKYIGKEQCLASNIDQIASVVKIKKYVSDIKAILKVDNVDEKYCYYTNLDVLMHSLPNGSEDDEKSINKLAIMNASYMNDPNEGSLLNNALNLGETCSEELHAKSVYLKSFTLMYDYLPMWSMYGNNGEGVCVVIDWNKTKNQIEKLNIPLYKVCYINNLNKDDLIIDKNINKGIDTKKIKSLLFAIKQEIEKLDSICLEEKRDLVVEISYLFKNSTYSYEKEVRLIFYNQGEINNTNEKYPLLFVLPPFYIAFDEIVLGPKFKDVDKRLPYLESLIDKMYRTCGISKPRIKKSKIMYR